MSYQTSFKRSSPFWFLIGGRKLLCFSAQLEARTAATVWNWSGKTLGTLRFATTDGWTRVARCLGDWIEYGALWRVVARKLKLSCYTTNYVLREIAAVEFTLKMSFQKVRDELIYCFADGILDEEEFVLLYDAYKSTNSIYPYWEYDEFSCRTLVKRSTSHGNILKPSNLLRLTRRFEGLPFRS